MAIKVSIIIPVYNTGEYLRGCLDSVLQQTLTEWELLLIDDGSKDQSGRICDEYAARDQRIRVIHKQNEGVSIARNTGLSMAQGEYIGFVDSDDTIDSRMYEKMYEAAVQNDAEIVMCDAVTVYNDHRREPDTIHQLHSNCLIQKKDWSPALLKEMAGSACRCIYSSALIQRHGVRFPVAQKFSEDRVFNLYAMGYANKLIYLKEAYYNRLVWEGSAVHRFHPDYFDSVKLAAKETNSALKIAWSNTPEYQAAYSEQFVSASIAAINNYFYKTSPWTIPQKVKAVKRLCDDEQLQTALQRDQCCGVRGKWIRDKRVRLLSVSAIVANLRHGR